MYFKHATARGGNISVARRRTYPIDEKGIFEIPDDLVDGGLAERLARAGHTEVKDPSKVPRPKDIDEDPVVVQARKAQAKRDGAKAQNKKR